MGNDEKLPRDEEAIDRNWHPNYVNYTEMIVSHPNYQGLPFERDSKTGRIKWVAAGKSAKGKQRTAWWDSQCKKYGIPIQKGCYAVISRLIHPTKEHVCQCCGRALSIYYVYPTKNTIKQLQAILPSFASVGDVAPADYDIYTIIDEFSDKQTERNAIARYLDLPIGKSATELKELIRTQLADGNTSKLSPGAMSNCPDRLEGYHSDGLCCRERTDKGRHTDNMKTYTQDRRAYEDWSDGNYRLANRLMGEFNKGDMLYRCPKCGNMEKMTADHIGPISLGFCHTKYFTPLCKKCNSSKNNRFTKSDVDELLRLEQNGETIISWHSKPIWNLLKHKINNDSDAKKASSLMAEFHQNVICVLAIIYKKTGRAFLERYLHPEFSLYDYRFNNFDPFHLDRLEIIETPVDSKNSRSNQERYKRIAFDSLEDFLDKDNRRHELYFNENTPVLNEISDIVNFGDYNGADRHLKGLLKGLAEYIVEQKWSV